MNIVRAEMIATDLLKYYLSKFIFSFDKSKRRFGYCLTCLGRSKISISSVLTELNSEEQFIDTVLHEIAHALTPNEHHSHKWRKAALAIGCNGSRCYSSEVIKPAARYIGTCPACFKIIQRFRRLKLACRNCCLKNGGRFDSSFEFKWKKV